jgi:tetratricopeptide (TPR) repeat protein
MGPGRLICHPLRPRACRAALLACWLVFGLGREALGVEGERAGTALQAFRQAQAEYKKQPHDAQAAWHFGRACFELADYATNNAERAEIAGRGIAGCQQGIVLDTNSAPGHYYLGLNLGQLARTRDLGALKLVDEMEQEFLRAIKLDAAFDYAGAERSLGLLYRDAPSIVSIGSRTKARQHLQRALQLAPQYPENRLILIESCLKWGDRSGAIRELKTLDETWPKAQADFTGPAWTASWAEWEARREQARKKLEAPARLEAPRH